MLIRAGHYPHFYAGVDLKKLQLIFAFLFLSCNRWEYDDPSSSKSFLAPETYLTLVATDTIYSSLDSLGNTVISTNEDLNTEMLWDTLAQAFSTVTSSKQELYWWGEDPDGDVTGYWYKWNTDTSWTFTTFETGVFYVPIRSDLDVFSFKVKAVDNDGNEDLTPSVLTLPIKNSPPDISFRYLSNPLIADVGGDTSFTFPTRTFVWDLYDQDGNETITDIFYALDDTCNNCWVRLDGNASSVTLTDLDPGERTFYLKARDIAGAESNIISFPDSLRPSESQAWIVKPVLGEILIVDDYPLDNSNNALNWYSALMDTLTGPGGHSFWELGDALPYSSTDISSNLNYFKTVIWFAAYTNTAAASNQYNDAESNLVNYVMNGGNLFINPIQFGDSTFAWFPLDSLVTINPSGRLFTGTGVMSTINSELDLGVSHLINVRSKGIWPDESEFDVLTELYHMPDPGGSDGWNGNPTVCSMGQFRISPVELSGKVVIMTLPLHDGIRPKLQGNGSVIKFFQHLLENEF